MVLGNLKLVFWVMVFFQVSTKEGRIWIEIWEGWRRERLDCCENWSPFMCVHCVCLIRFTENFQLCVLNFTIVSSWHWYWIPDMNPKLGSKKYMCFFSLSRQYKSVSFKQNLNLGMTVVIIGFTFGIFGFLPCWSLMDGLHTIIVFSTVSIRSAIFPFCYKRAEVKIPAWI